jgi:REP element-mobilizing transposase RayT
MLSVLNKCFAEGKVRPGFRVVHYGVMGDHVHLIVEGVNREALSRGMQGLAIRLAKALNRFWGRKRQGGGGMDS